MLFGSLIKAALLVFNALAVLDEKRFLSKYGYDEIDLEGISSGSLKSQISELLRMSRLMRMPLVGINCIAMLFDVVGMVMG